MTLEELGAVLRNEREKRALSIDHVSEILKISARLLRALEEGDMASLPHPAYIRGFIRSYASFLGLTAEEISSAVIPAAQDGRAAPQANARPFESPKKPRGKGRLLAIALLVAVAGIAAVAWRPLYSTLVTAPKRLAEPSPPAEQERPLFSAPQDKTDADTQKPDMAQNNSATPSLLPPEAAPIPPAEPLTPATAGITDTARTRPSPHNVIITATEECWIHSRADGTDTRQFSLRKGDTFALTFRHTLDLKLGNAGGVRIRYNGQPLPSPGLPGQVRTLTFPPQARQE
ncbi:MAG: DUF4115 domain-containing protein [Desulfovibrio sp.]|jgi:cytoskeleton protein RodZ|nr:DUF4115 domain-containing protein [Desulfovibrio sp.]